jgi:hypothetical protein
MLAFYTKAVASVHTTQHMSPQRLKCIVPLALSFALPRTTMDARPVISAQLSFSPEGGAVALTANEETSRQVSSLCYHDGSWLALTIALWHGALVPVMTQPSSQTDVSARCSSEQNAGEVLVQCCPDFLSCSWQICRICRSPPACKPTSSPLGGCLPCRR